MLRKEMLIVIYCNVSMYFIFQLVNWLFLDSKGGLDMYYKILVFYIYLLLEIKSI
jgi:hypothetical protein